MDDLEWWEKGDPLHVLISKEQGALKRAARGRPPAVKKETCTGCVHIEEGWGISACKFNKPVKFRCNKYRRKPGVL